MTQWPLCSASIKSLFLLVFLSSSCKHRSGESGLNSVEVDNILVNSGLAVTTELSGFNVMIDPMCWIDRNDKISPSRRDVYANMVAGLQRAFRKMPPYENSNFIGLIDGGKNLHAIAAYKKYDGDKVELDFLVARPAGTAVPKVKYAGAILMAQILVSDPTLKTITLAAATYDLLPYYRDLGFVSTRGLNMTAPRARFMSKILEKLEPMMNIETY